MSSFVLGVGLISLSGVLAWVLASAGRERLAVLAAAAGMVAGSAVALAPALAVLGGAAPVSSEGAWAVPGGSLAMGIDRLSAWFLLAVLGVSAVVSVYSVGYLEHYRGKRPLGGNLLWFNLLAASMALVIVARNVVLFIFGWELMLVFAFLAMTLEDEREDVRSAGFTYIVLNHVATMFVIAFFLLLLLARGAGSLEFAASAAAPALAPGLAGLLFVLAILGFGTKAGIWPLHVWLPEAHPLAPSHVSAVMSGVIVKTALYGLVRGLTLMGPPRPEWGVALVAIGAASAVIGVVYALAQHDLKRLLAYHTIENVGIILLGIGTGTLALAHGARGVAAVAFAGGLLHVLNHAIFKALLFLGAGSVAGATRTRDIERLGGLGRLMPITATTFLVGAVAISGLPPLNGFASEWLVYAGFLGSARALPHGAALAAIGGVAALALVGGLAAACFAKAFGVVFLGSPRTDAALGARERSPSMAAAMIAMAVVCFGMGLFPDVVGKIAIRVGEEVVTATSTSTSTSISPAQPERSDRAGPVADRNGWIAESKGAESAAALTALGGLARGTGLVLVLALVLVATRDSLLSRRVVTAGGTWGCGYSFPTARMQYTASSFAGPLLSVFRGGLRTVTHGAAPAGYFPRPAARSTHTPELVAEAVLRPGIRLAARAIGAARWMQQGRLQVYVLYILITVVALLLWQWIGIDAER